MEPKTCIPEYVEAFMLLDLSHNGDTINFKMPGHKVTYVVVGSNFMD